MDEYRKIGEEVNQKFNRQLQKAIQKRVSVQPQEMQEIYATTGYVKKTIRNVPEKRGILCGTSLTPIGVWRGGFRLQ